MFNQQQLLFDQQDVQKMAADPRSSVYLAASAGTGKTKVLCDRFLRLLLAGSKPASIFCVTFTKAAASEMLKRIIEKLEYWQKVDDAKLMQELRLLAVIADQQMCKKARMLYDNFIAEFDHLKIFTLHAFCQSVLTKYSENNSTLKNFEIIDALKARELKRDAFEQAINQENLHDDVLFIIEFLDLKNIFDDVSFLLNSPNKLLAIPHDYVSRLECQYDVEGFFQQNLPALERLLQMFQAAGSKKVSTLKSALTNKDIKGVYKTIYTDNDTLNSRLFTKKFLEQYPSYESEILSLANATVKAFKDYGKSITFAASKSIINIAKATNAIYKKAKQDAGVIEYEDLLYDTKNLLINSPSSLNVLYKLDYAIDHILVDEAQDLNELQWSIIQAIADEFFTGESARELNRTIFIVGDFKQSIYGFQGAKPEIFLAIRDYYKSMAQNVNKQFLELEMSTSFRSVATVLNAVDQLFATTHKPFRKGDGVFEVMPLIPKHDEDGEKGWRFPSKVQDSKSPHANLAIVIAEQIAAWVQNAKRSCKDIMILTKKRSELTWSLGEELLKRHIPFVYQDKVLLNEELLALDLLALLKFITLPQDDYNLACLLKSPFFNLEEAALFKLCAAREITLWETLQTNNEFEDLAAKLFSFIKLSENNNLKDFLKIIIGNEGYYRAFQQRFGYKSSVIINLFLSAVILFEENNPLTFLGFTEWFWQNNLEFDLPQSSQDAVRIMTCHAAKGLQAPVVIIADSASTEQVPYSRTYWHDDLPLYSLGGIYDHDVLAALKNDRKANEAEENSRLLYVAMTRAEDELYFAGWNNRYIKNSWYERAAAIANVSQMGKIGVTHVITPIKDLVNFSYPEFFDRKLELPEEMSFSATVFSPVKTKQILYGEFIHEVLSKYVKLPARKAYDIEKIIEHVAGRYVKKIDASTIEAGKNKIKETVAKFKELLTSSLTEVPISGFIDAKFYSVRVDLLKLEGDCVSIIDFKTDNEMGKKVSYLAQLKIYKELSGKIWPEMKIRCYILWIEHLTLEEIIV